MLLPWKSKKHPVLGPFSEDFSTLHFVLFFHLTCHWTSWQVWKGCFLYLVHSDGIYFPMYHVIEPKTLVLQQVCSIMPIELCHHPSQVCKGVWEIVTSFAHMESECKLFQNCDLGRVLFVEGKWTNLLGCVGKYPPFQAWQWCPCAGAWDELPR